jgi:hypothetical protein
MYVINCLCFIVRWVEDIVNGATFFSTSIIMMRMCFAFRRTVRDIPVITMRIKKAYHPIFMVVMGYDSMSQYNYIGKKYK